MKLKEKYRICIDIQETFSIPLTKFQFIWGYTTHQRSIYIRNYLWLCPISANFVFNNSYCDSYCLHCNNRVNFWLVLTDWLTGAIVDKVFAKKNSWDDCSYFCEISGICGDLVKGIGQKLKIEENVIFTKNTEGSISKASFRSPAPF